MMNRDHCCVHTSPDNRTNMRKQPRNPKPGFSSLHRKHLSIIFFMSQITKNGSFHPAIWLKRRGEKSLAGLMADPAFRPKLKTINTVCDGVEHKLSDLRWIAVSPSPIVIGIILLCIFMFLSSVTARTMMSNMAVPRIWSTAKLLVVTSLTSKKG